MKKCALLIVGLAVLAGCSAPKPTAEEIAAAKRNDPIVRDIEKSKEVAKTASERSDDPALH